MKKNLLSVTIPILLLLFVLNSCGTQKEALEVSEHEKEVFKSGGEEPVAISDDKTAYEIIIIEKLLYFNYLVIKISWVLSPEDKITYNNIHNIQ